MDSDLMVALVAGGLRDPILWIVGAVLGWDHKRDLKATMLWLATSGALWGAVRSFVYRSFGESMDAGLTVTMILVCAGLMVAVGIAVRAARAMFSSGRNE